MGTPFYYRGFNVAEIDNDGFVQPVVSIDLDVENITTSTSLGTVPVDANGIVAEGSFNEASGDVIEFSHGSYPLKFRQTLTDTQDQAYLHPDNNVVTYILENSYASTTEVETAELYAQDLDDMGQRPQLLGTVKAGVTTPIPFQTSVGKNLRLMLVSKDSSGAQDIADFSYAQSEDVSIPALAPGTVTSVALTVPGFLSVSGSPITGSGTLAVSLANQPANTVFKGPNSGGAAAPTFAALVLADISASALGTGTANSTTYLRGDRTWQTISTGLTVGTTPIASGGANRVLFHSASGDYVDESDRFKFDGSDALLTNPASASGGSPSIASPKFVFTGASWSGSVSQTARVRMYVNPTNNTYGSGPKLVVDFDRGDGFYPSGGGGLLSYGNPGADYLTARLEMRNPSMYGHGGFLDVTYDGQFAFRTVSGTLSGLQPGYISWTGAGNLGYQTIRPYSSPYGITFQSQFGVPIQFKQPESGFGSNYDVYIEPKTMIGASTAPTAQLQVRSTTEQVRIEYDASNYESTTISSTGVVTRNAVGSGAKFAFSDAVEVADGGIFGPMIADTASVYIDGPGGVYFDNDMTPRVALGDWNANGNGTQLIVDDNDQTISRNVGSGGEFAHVGGKLFQHFADETTTGTTQENLYTFTLPAGSLTQNGDTIKCEYSGVFTANTNTKRIFPKFGSTVLATGQVSTAGATDWTVDFYIMRVSNTVVRFGLEFTATGEAPTIESGEITGLNLTTTGYNIDLDGRTVTSAGQLTAHSGLGVFHPAA